MKNLIPMLLIMAVSLSLSSSAFAVNKEAFYINNAYYKGDGKYDVVVRDTNRATLRLYVNDKNPVKAKANKEGWATFRNVEFAGQSKVSFAKRVMLKYVPMSYVKYISVDDKRVQLSNTGPKHSYDEFYKWSTSERYDAMNGAIGSAYQQIMAICGEMDRDFGSKWTACMQEGYMDYLKPETFADNNWTGDYSAMVGYINEAGTEKSWHGSQSETNKYKKAMKEARKIYERLAVTN